MSDLTIARYLGYPEYPEVDISNESTFGRLSKDVHEYLKSRPWAPGYHCWIPNLGCTLIGTK